MGCGCKKRNQTPVQPSNTVVMTEGQSTTTQQINLVDQQQVELLVRKIEEINDTLEETEE
mgnify:CR=1 FL=1|jgi:two-component SAPR family response regulator